MGATRATRARGAFVRGVGGGLDAWKYVRVVVDVASRGGWVRGVGVVRKGGDDADAGTIAPIHPPTHPPIHSFIRLGGLGRLLWDRMD